MSKLLSPERLALLTKLVATAQDSTGSALLDHIEALTGQIAKAKEEAALAERGFWIGKFEHWVNCAASAPQSIQYIKSQGFNDCVLAMMANDRWLPKAAEEGK